MDEKNTYYRTNWRLNYRAEECIKVLVANEKGGLNYGIDLIACLVNIMPFIAVYHVCRAVLNSIKVSEIFCSFIALINEIESLEMALITLFVWWSYFVIIILGEEKLDSLTCQTLVRSVSIYWPKKMKIYDHKHVMMDIEERLEMRNEFRKQEIKGNMILLNISHDLEVTYYDIWNQLWYSCSNQIRIISVNNWPRLIMSEISWFPEFQDRH